MAEATERINISKEVAAICKKLGLEPPFTKSIHLTPTQAEVVIYLKNNHGHKYTTATTRGTIETHEYTETGFHEPAVETKTFEVRT